MIKSNNLKTSLVHPGVSKDVSLAFYSSVHTIHSNGMTLCPHICAYTPDGLCNLDKRNLKSVAVGFFGFVVLISSYLCIVIMVDLPF